MLSIIICTLNEEYYLPKLLNSIEQQQGVEYEIIIVDGNSCDDTQKVACLYKDKGLPIEFLTLTDKRNIGAQRNHGAKNANYEQLLFLDADVILPEDFLKLSLYQIDRNGILVAGTRQYSIEREASFRMMYWSYSNVYLPTVRIFAPVINGCSIFSTKSIHFKIGGFDEDVLFEDFKYGKDAKQIYRPRLLKKVYVKTSARRFYHISFRIFLEMVFAGFYNFFKAGIKEKHLMQEYNKSTGNHPRPRY